MTKLVVACVTAEDLEAIRHLASSAAQVIAVAFDFGHGRLRELYDQARATGAARCHVLDVREEFALDYLLPAIRQPAGASLTDADISALARECLEKKLAQVADLEGDATVRPPASMPAPATYASRPGAAIDRAAHVEIAFASGVPVALNGIPMSIVELIDCLSAIGAAHGVGAPAAAFRLLQRAYHTRDPLDAQSAGIVRLQLFQGQISDTRAYATT